MNEPDLTAGERRAIHKTLRMFDVFRSVDPSMPIGTVASFLHVAYNEGQSVRDLEVLGFSKASASNHARYLGEGAARSGKPGLGLIAHKLDPMDVRIKRLSLTPKGELLAAQVANVVGRQSILRWAVQICPGAQATMARRRHQDRYGSLNAGASRVGQPTRASTRLGREARDGNACVNRRDEEGHGGNHEPRSTCNPLAILWQS